MIFNNSNENDMEIELEELNELSDAILTKYGFDFTNYAQSSFKRRVLMALKKNGIKNVASLIHKIIQDRLFFEQFVTDITVNTTELFRDPTFFQVLREQVLPILNTRPEFNIWHAACSSGEEVISMAILLKEEGMLDRAKIYATDINTTVLKKAAEAKYPVRNWDLYKQNYLNTNPKSALENYCEIQDNEIQFNKELIQNVKFKQHDLAVDHHFFKFDLILCRNVMIYFNQKLQNRVFELLHASLFLGGFLALGAKESLIWCKIADKFAPFNENEKIFKKIKL
jgi:chemotaxis protein methyltransferase CheR